MSRPFSSTTEPDARSQALSRIAETLGCPVEAFADGDLSHDLPGTLQLLNLWASLKSEASRVAVLRLIKAVVEAEEG